MNYGHSKPSQCHIFHCLGCTFSSLRQQKGYFCSVFSCGSVLRWQEWLLQIPLKYHSSALCMGRVGACQSHSPQIWEAGVKAGDRTDLLYFYLQTGLKGCLQVWRRQNPTVTRGEADGRNWTYGGTVGTTVLHWVIKRCLSVTAPRRYPQVQENMRRHFVGWPSLYFQHWWNGCQTFFFFPRNVLCGVCFNSDVVIQICHRELKQRYLKSSVMDKVDILPCVKEVSVKDCWRKIQCVSFAETNCHEKRQP